MKKITATMGKAATAARAVTASKIARKESCLGAAEADALRVRGVGLTLLDLGCSERTALALVRAGVLEIKTYTTGTYETFEKWGRGCRHTNYFADITYKVAA